jgi:hypothetical protein
MNYGIKRNFCRYRTGTIFVKERLLQSNVKFIFRKSCAWIPYVKKSVQRQKYPRTFLV